MSKDAHTVAEQKKKKSVITKHEKEQPHYEERKKKNAQSFHMTARQPSSKMKATKQTYKQTDETRRNK